MSTATVGTTQSLADAITAVENASSKLANDQSLQTSAQATIDANKAKYDASVSAKAPVDQAVSDDVTAFNSTLDGLISAATASKIAVTTNS